MPYMLGGRISSAVPGLWGEGFGYRADEIYSLASAANNPKAPPVNASFHILSPHSITHVDAASHIIGDGATIERYFSPTRQNCFYGPVTVAKLQGAGWREVAGATALKIWRVSKTELIAAVRVASGKDTPPNKLFLTVQGVPLNEHGYHDPNFIMVLEPEAAEWLVSNSGFNAWGTSWKSSDFEPGSSDRPVHKILLRQAVLYELLTLHDVPQGEYFLAGVPLLIEGGSESPVAPVLFMSEELSWT
ncbi:MAG: cyclase family protein [Oligoflexia bacterium]|nr:cyclase family protein [Oligoflexia bacterium]